MTSGQPAAIKSQGSYPGCTITVSITGTTTLASLYSDNAGTTKANPFTADAGTGAFNFFVGSGTVFDVKKTLPTGAITLPSQSAASGYTTARTVSDTPFLLSGQTFYQACMSAAMLGVTLTVSNNWSVTTTNSCAASVLFYQGGVVQPTSGQIVTFKAQAGLYTICNITSGGNCNITGATGEVYPEWWGFSQSVSDGHASFIAATTALNNMGGGVLHFSAGTYSGYTNTFGSNTWIRGSGVGATTLKLPAGANTDVLQGLGFLSLDNTQQQVPETRGANFTKLTDITLDGNRSNNSTGYGARIWGHSEYWQNVTYQNCASGGLLTEYSDGSGFTFFPANPKLGDPEAWFENIKTTGNNGNGITFEGPNDARFQGLISTGDTGWAMTFLASLLQGVVNTSGTSLTWVSGSNFATFVPGGGITIPGVGQYTISSCSSSTSCILTVSAGTNSSVGYTSVFYLGAADLVFGMNCYGEGVGCVNEGPNAGSLHWVSGYLTDSPIGLTMDPADGDEKFTAMTINGNSNYGIKLQGTGNHLEATEISSNGTGLILGTGASQVFVDVHGSGNTTAINNIGSSTGFVNATFRMSAGQTLFTGSSWDSTMSVQLNGATAGSGSTQFVQLSGVVDPYTNPGQLYVESRNPTTPADYVYMYHTGSTGDAHVDTTNGSLFLADLSKAPVVVGGGILRTNVVFTIAAGANHVPACSGAAGINGQRVFVSDLLSPAYLQPVTGGGTQAGWVTCIAGTYIAE